MPVVKSNFRKASDVMQYVVANQQVGPAFLENDLGNHSTRNCDNSEFMAQAGS